MLTVSYRDLIQMQMPLKQTRLAATATSKYPGHRSTVRGHARRSHRRLVGDQVDLLQKQK